MIKTRHFQNEELPVERICYPSMRHEEEGDEEVAVKDYILLASGNRKKDLPYSAHQPQHFQQQPPFQPGKGGGGGVAGVGWVEPDPASATHALKSLL